MQIIYKIEKIPEGGYMAFCPDIKPVVVEGDTESAVTKKLIMAAKMYLKYHPEYNNTLRSIEIN